MHGEPWYPIGQLWETDRKTATMKQTTENAVNLNGMAQFSSFKSTLFSTNVLNLGDNVYYF